ncbi:MULTISPECIES: ATP-binding cassette domain-containing protein [Calditerrivibrio]|uniref:ATP-binding cassette domain-containing protein n=1 Tax=Calditerrivibrio TaxID=545865 RepID=UPI003C7697AF
MNAVSIYNLKKNYKKLTALKNVTLTIPKNKLTCIVGPDGAGKSTLLKIIAGVLTFDEGELYINDKKIVKISEMEDFKDKIAFMPQGLGLNLYQNLSIEENIDFFASLHDLDKNKAAKRKETLLKITNLYRFKEREVSKLSGGMKQKLGICCSLIHSPELMILDEPTTGVDPVSRKELYLLIHQFIEEEGITAVISTSYIDEAERGDKIIILNDGQIILDDKNFKDDINVYEISSPDFLEIYNRLNSEEYHFIKLNRDNIRLSPKNNEMVIKDWHQVKPTLDDRILSVIGTRKLDFIISPQKLRDSNIIDIKNISKNFGNFFAVKDVSLEIKKGEIMGLLGPNGAGKTTLIKLILNLYTPTSGYIKIDVPESELKNSIGYMSQKFSLYSDLTVRENLLFYGSTRGVSLSRLKARVEELIDLGNLKMYKDEIVENLPLGIRQRLALMTSIMHNPEIIFLDEPTAGVNIAERDTFWQIIRYLSNNHNITIIVSTHYMDEANYCDRLCLMFEGKISLIGTPDELKRSLEEKAGTPCLIETENPYLLYSELKQKGLKVDLLGNKVKLFTKDRAEALKNYDRIYKTEVTVEDVFVSVTEDEYS